MTNNLNIIILAAGKGTRMKSEKLKVLHPLAGKAIIDHVLDTAKLLNPNKIIMVYGHQGEQLKKYLEHENVVWVEQNNRQPKIAKSCPKCMRLSFCFCLVS